VCPLPLPCPRPLVLRSGLRLPRSPAGAPGARQLATVPASAVAAPRRLVGDGTVSWQNATEAPPGRRGSLWMATVLTRHREWEDCVK
jgi:hypothetical protein